MSQTIEATARRFLEEQDRRRGELAPELCTDDYVAHIGSIPPMDIKGHAEFAAPFHAACPDLRHVIEDVVPAGDRVTVRFRLKGTNTEPFMGAPASGRPIDVGALVLLTISGGKVSELRGEFDQLGAMQQLGVIPTEDAR